MKRPVIYLAPRLALFLALLFVLSGCFGSSTPGTTIEHLKGWLHYSNPAEGFGLKVPDSWIVLSPDQADLQSAIKSVRDANPALADALDAGGLQDQIGNMSGSGVKVLAYDTTSNIAATNFATNLNVVRLPLPSGATSLDALANINVGELEQAFGSMLTTDIFRTRTHVGSDKTQAVLLQYSYSANLATGAVVDAQAYQYLVIKNQDEYVLTFTTTKQEIGAKSYTFDQIAANLELTR